MNHTPVAAVAAVALFYAGSAFASGYSSMPEMREALSLEKGDPNGGEEMAQRWFDRAKMIDPENGVVRSLVAWWCKIK